MSGGCRAKIPLLAVDIVHLENRGLLHWDATIEWQLHTQRLAPLFFFNRSAAWHGSHWRIHVPYFVGKWPPAVAPRRSPRKKERFPKPPMGGTGISS